MANQTNFSNTLPTFQTAGIDLIVGSGAPTMKAPKGSLYINVVATTTTTRLYINTDGGTTWAYITTSA